MAYSTIEVLKENSVTTIKLNRPQKMNAVNETMCLELLNVFTNAVGDKHCRCLVLTGAGKAFCAGQDLGDLGGSFLDIIQRRYAPLILQMRRLPKPILASINGVAAGAGFSLALACDLRIASRAASFHPAFSKIGLVPDSGNSFYLPKLVGPSKALELYWLAELISATKALEMGLINFLTTAGKLSEDTNKLAFKLAQGPTRAFGLTKNLVNESLNLSLEQMLIEEAQSQEIASKTVDHKEGLKAFLEKRSPKFLGR